MEGRAKFAVLPKNCLDLWIEAAGIGRLTDDVVESLAEDATYRLREAVNNAIRIMKHCKRKCLTVDDMNLGLQQSNSQPIYGHGGLDNVTFKDLAFKDCKISYMDEREVNLRETALEPTYPADAGITTVKASWLVLEGHLCLAGQKNDEVGHKEQLDEPGQTYLKQVTSAIMGNMPYARKVALRDLASNPKIQVFLPHLISFFSTQIKQHTGKAMFSHVADLVLLGLRALTENSALLLAPYVFQLVKVMLYVVIEAQTPVSKWSTKTRAAVVLARLCRKHMNTLSYMPHQLLKAYQESLCDDAKPFSYTYGATVGITTLGPEAIYQVLYPCIQNKFKQLDRAAIVDTSAVTAYEILAVRTAIADAMSVFLIGSATGGHAQSQKACKIGSAARNYAAVYEELHDELGEQFTLRCLHSWRDEIGGVSESSFNARLKPGNSHLAGKTSSEAVRLLIGEKLRALQVAEEPGERAVSLETAVTVHTSLGGVVHRARWSRKIPPSALNAFSRDVAEDCELYQGSPVKKRKFSSDCSVPGTSSSHLSMKRKSGGARLDDLSHISISLPFL